MGIAARRGLKACAVSLLRFDRDFLGAVADAARTDKGGEPAFAAFQRRLLMERESPLHYDAFVASIIDTSAEAAPTVLQSTLLDLPDRALHTYAAVSAADDLSATAYANPGRMIRYQQIRSHEAWLSHPVFTDHLRHYGIFQGASVTYRTHGHRGTAIAFDYLGKVSNSGFETYDFTRLEVIGLPFVIGWLLRAGRIDAITLQNWIGALEGLTLTQVQNLRKFVNCPHETFEQQAMTLGVKELTLRKSLYAIRERVAARDTRAYLGYQVQPSGSLRPLEHYFRFLGMLGDPTGPLRIQRL